MPADPWRKTLRGFPPHGRDHRRGAFVGSTTRSLSTNDRSHAPRGNAASTLRRLSVMPAYPWWKTLRGFPPYGRDDRRGASVGWTTRSLSTRDRSTLRVG